MIPKNYTSAPTDNLKEKFLAEDSIKKRQILLTKYLKSRIAIFKNMLEDEKVIMGYEVDMQELVMELLQDLEMAQEQLNLTCKVDRKDKPKNLPKWRRATKLSSAEQVLSRFEDEMGKTVYNVTYYVVPDDEYIPIRELEQLEKEEDN